MIGREMFPVVSWNVVRQQDMADGHSLAFQLCLRLQVGWE